MNKEKYVYYLPQNGGCEPKQQKTETNSVIIIGANGSGKSRLGAWMEDKFPEEIHRIGAQRSLAFGTYIQQTSFEQAMNILTYGTQNEQPNHVNRWGQKQIDGNWITSYTTTLLNDYEHVLAAIVAIWHIEQNNYIKQCKEEEGKGNPHKPVPDMILDKLKSYWSQVFPHRQISFDDSKVTASINSSKYEGSEMSDGERVALYLIAQALCVPEGKTIIIDEPEIHLHRSIMNRLWAAIEQQRQDCLFIYITHDTQFAANHQHSDKIWVKEYDGKNWKWEFVSQTIFPEQLLLDILGNRKPVIFVEGTNDSYDTRLYTAIYKDYYVIPCGGCFEVISRTKAFRRLQNEKTHLHHVEAYGIIDRDFRVEKEIVALKENYIFTLEIAEIENLFLVEELLTFINKHQGYNELTRVERVKKYVIEERFCLQLERQICEATIAEIKHRLSVIEISKKQNEAQASFKTALSEIDFDTIQNECAIRYQKAATNKEYKQVLNLFNCKGICHSIGNYLRIDDKDYCDLVLRLINGEKNTEITSILLDYLPSENEIPRNLNCREVM